MTSAPPPVAQAPDSRTTFQDYLYRFLGGVLILVIAIPLYVYFTWVNPFIIVNLFLLALFAAMTMGGAALVTSGLGLDTRPNLKTIVTFPVVLLTYYTSWALFVMLYANLSQLNITLSDGEIGNLLNGAKSMSFNGAIFVHYFTHPGDILEAMHELNRMGTTGIEGWTFRGWWLWIVWLIEGLVVCVPALLITVPEPSSNTID